MENENENENANQVIIQGPLPDLSKAKQSPVSFTSTYIDIDELEKNQKFDGFYLGVNSRDQINDDTGEVKQLKIMLIAVQQEDKSIEVMESAATQLVGTLESLENEGKITRGKTAIRITYLGKKKNKTNSFSSAKWKINPLVF